jgi:hypothetical protein
MGKVIPFCHILAVLFRDAGQSIIPFEGRQAMFPPLSIDEIVDPCFQVRNNDFRLWPVNESMAFNLRG